MPPQRFSLRLAHIADLHLGAGYSHGDEDKGGVNSRLVDFRAAWVRSCRQMVDADVDLVALAGDAFDTAKPTPTEMAAFRAGLNVLCDANIPMVAVVGNHDLPKATGRTDAVEIFDGWRSLVRVVSQPTMIDWEFPETNPDGSYTVVEHLPVAVFPWPTRAWMAARCENWDTMDMDTQHQKMVDESLKALWGLGAQAQQAAGPLGSILVGHMPISGSVVGAEQSTSFLREPVLPLPELRGLPFRYQAWGHLHKAQELEPHIRYAGAIERTDFAEEIEDKGWWLVDLTEDGVRTEWCSSSPRPFLTIELPDPTAWEGTLSMLAGFLPGAVVRVRYQATPEVARTVDHGGIRRALYAAGAVKVHGPFAQIEHVVTRLENPVDEETSPLAGWRAWGRLQGYDTTQLERLDRKVVEALEVLA